MPSSRQLRREGQKSPLVMLDWLRNFSEQERSVRSSKAKAVTYRLSNRCLPPFFGHVVEVEAVLDMLKIESRRNDPFLQCHDCEGSFDRTRSSKQMANCPFGGADEDILSQ